MGKKSNLSLQVYVGHPEVCWHKPESPNIGRFLLQVYAVGGEGAADRCGHGPGWGAQGKPVGASERDKGHVGYCRKYETLEKSCVWDLSSEQAADSVAEGSRNKSAVPISCPKVGVVGSRRQLEQGREGEDSRFHFAGVSDPSR